MVNSVFTLYDLSNGDDTEGEGRRGACLAGLCDWLGSGRLTRLLPAAEFHGLEEWMLLRSLQALQNDGRAEIITMDDAKGVKFF